LKYFNKYYGGVYTDSATQTGNVYWNLRKNFINGYNKFLAINDPYNQAALDRDIRSLGVFDIFAGATPLSLFRFADAIINHSKN